jgi:hypothetical protein
VSATRWQAYRHPAGDNRDTCYTLRSISVHRLEFEALESSDWQVTHSRRCAVLEDQFTAAILPWNSCGEPTRGDGWRLRKFPRSVQHVAKQAGAAEPRTSPNPSFSLIFSRQSEKGSSSAEFALVICARPRISLYFSLLRGWRTVRSGLHPPP